MNTPLVNPNDPKWTAYVLGELDEADRASVERLLETSPEARALVNELKLAASAIDDVLTTSEPPELLTAAQRAAVRDAADAGRANWFAVVPMRWGWGFGAAAAAIIVAAVVPLLPETSRPAVVSKPGAARPTTEPTRTASQAADSRAQPPAAAAKSSSTASEETIRNLPTTPSGGSTTNVVGGLTREGIGGVPGATAVNPSNVVPESTVKVDAAGGLAESTTDAPVLRLA